MPIVRRPELHDVQRKVTLYLGLGRFDAAEKLLRATINDFGPLSNLLNLLGIACLRQSKFADAIKFFRQAFRENPAFIEAALNLSILLCDMSEYEEASEVFAQTVAQTKSSRNRPELVMGRLANHHVRCGELYEESALFADAIQEYRKALTLFAKMPDVKLRLGKLYFRTAQREKAQLELEDLVRHFPEDFEAHMWLGIVYHKLGRYDLAKVHWEKSKTLAPNDLAAHALARVGQLGLKSSLNLPISH